MVTENANVFPEIQKHSVVIIQMNYKTETPLKGEHYYPNIKDSVTVVKLTLHGQHKAVFLCLL